MVGGGGATNAIKLATPLGWAYDVTLGVVGFARKVDDPTRASIPLIGDNPEAKFFDALEKSLRRWKRIRFPRRSEHSVKGCGGRLANSNQRSAKGFEPTEELEPALRTGRAVQAGLDLRTSRAFR